MHIGFLKWIGMNNPYLYADKDDKYKMITMIKLIQLMVIFEISQLWWWFDLIESLLQSSTPASSSLPPEEDKLEYSDKDIFAGSTAVLSSLDK